MGKNYSQELYGLDYVDVKAIFNSHEAKMHNLTFRGTNDFDKVYRGTIKVQICT